MIPDSGPGREKALTLIKWWKPQYVPFVGYFLKTNFKYSNFYDTINLLQIYLPIRRMFHINNDRIRQYEPRIPDPTQTLQELLDPDPDVRNTDPQAWLALLRVRYGTCLYPDMDPIDSTG
jgi:hypothetical protein